MAEKDIEELSFGGGIAAKLRRQAKALLSLGVDVEFVQGPTVYSTQGPSELALRLKEAFRKAVAPLADRHGHCAARWKRIMGEDWYSQTAEEVIRARWSKPFDKASRLPHRDVYEIFPQWGKGTQAIAIAVPRYYEFLKVPHPYNEVLETVLSVGSTHNDDYYPLEGRFWEYPADLDLADKLEALETAGYTRDLILRAVLAR